MKKILLYLSLFPFMASAAVTSDSVENKIKQGGTQAIQGLDSATRNAIYTGISNGEGDWIKLVPQLVTSAPKGMADMLGISLAKGLPNNPLAVISVIDDKKHADIVGTSIVCTMPFANITKDALYLYHERAHIALISMSSGSDKCLAELDDKMKQLKSLDESGFIPWGIESL